MPALTGNIFRNALPVSIVFQLVLFAFALLIPDFGNILQIWAITMVAYWSGTIMIMVRRFKTPTKLDLFLVQWSFPFLMVLIAVPLVMWIWKLRGWL